MRTFFSPSKSCLEQKKAHELLRKFSNSIDQILVNGLTCSWIANLYSDRLLDKPKPNKMSTHTQGLSFGGFCATHTDSTEHRHRRRLEVCAEASLAYIIVADEYENEQ